MRDKGGKGLMAERQSEVKLCLKCWIERQKQICIWLGGKCGTVCVILFNPERQRLQIGTRDAICPSAVYACPECHVLLISDIPGFTQGHSVGSKKMLDLVQLRTAISEELQVMI